MALDHICTFSVKEQSNTDTLGAVLFLNISQTPQTVPGLSCSTVYPLHIKNAGRRSGEYKECAPWPETAGVPKEHSVSH